MREIKFRAWDTELNVMEYFGLTDISYDSNNFYSYMVGGIVIHSKGQGDNPAVNIMQYTGLKDKNDQELYEDDIVKSNVCNFIIRFGEYSNNNDDKNTHLGFYLEQVGNEVPGIRCDFLFWLNECNLIKIGNIHENPELLENVV